MGTPDEVPPAFRGRNRRIPPFLGIDDDQLIKIAANAHNAAQRLPFGSAARAEQWTRYDDAASELSARAFRQTVAKIREHIEAGDDVPEVVRDAAALPLDIARGGEP